MMAIGKVLGIALLVGGLLLWAASVLPPLPKFNVDAVPDEPMIASPLPPSDDGYAVLTGIVIYDEDKDLPTPYIAYAYGKGTRTKQLVFRDRGCSPAAGDIPCAPGTATYPDIPEGINVQVTGVINGDQIFVEQIKGIY